MTAPRSTDRFIREFLAEGQTELPDPVYDVIRDRIEQTRQRAVIGSWGVPEMNKFVAIGLTAAAAVVIALIAFNLLPGSPAPGGEPTPSPSATDSASATETVAYAMSMPGLPGEVTVTVPVSWSLNTWYVQRNRVYMNVWPTPVSNVYGNPCQWEGSLPDPPVGPTVDDLATALANQPTRNATVEDVTLDGYSGKVVHMSVPADQNFGDCDLGQFASWTEPGSDSPSRYHQGPGQMDDVYILDVEGVRVVINAATFPDSAAADIADLDAILASLTIQP